MNPPQKPVRPPEPPPVPKDHIPDANKMVDTPRTDADLWSFPGPIKVDGGINVYVRASTARAIERELAAANDKMSEQAKILLDTVNDRNRLGTQLDLVRDELKRIPARILESGLGDNPYLSNIAAYCFRAQADIAVNYTPIQERDKLSNELAAANRRIEELEQWIRGLEEIPGSDEVTGLFGDEWPFDGKCAYVGPQKPEGLR